MIKGWGKNEVLTEKLPVGRSTFHTLREQGKIHVDKTAQIYELAVQSQKFFFARPRRFGKSSPSRPAA